MRKLLLFEFLFFAVFELCQSTVPKVARITELEQIKALIKARNSVLVYYHVDGAVIGNVLIDVAEHGIPSTVIAFVYCQKGNEAICRDMNVNPKPFVLRHYYEGVFNLDYNKDITEKDIKRFLENPLTEIAWKEEDGGSRNLVHIESEEQFIECIDREKQKRTLFLFYIPDSKECREFKATWTTLAGKFKSKFEFAAINMRNKENAQMGIVYQIKKYPSIQFFENGVHMYEYTDEFTMTAIAKWLKNPQHPEPQTHDRDPEEHWENDPNSLVVHLTDDTFASFIKKNYKVLVVFHAQWCGHCKKLAPVIENVVRRSKAEGHAIVITAIDGSKNEMTRNKYHVDGYPKIKFFEKGQFRYDVNERYEEPLMQWMREPAGQAPSTSEWSSSKSNVVHLTDDTWHTVEDVKHSLILFYAPWCGHCKNVKSAWFDTAAVLKKKPQFLIGAVDCTIERTLCQRQEVGAYPTLKYYHYGDLTEVYRGGRSQTHFVSFLMAKDKQDGFDHSEL